jgi:hypothetical protein
MTAADDTPDITGADYVEHALASLEPHERDRLELEERIGQVKDVLRRLSKHRAKLDDECTSWDHVPAHAYDLGDLIGQARRMLAQYRAQLAERGGIT